MELSRNLKIDSVRRLQPIPPVLVEADRPVGEAVGLMRDGRVGCVLVTDAGALAGIFTERDLLTRVLAADLPLTTAVRAVMTPSPVTVDPHEAVSAAIGKMQAGGYRHLPVIGDDGRPVGLLSAKRVVRYLVEHFPGLVLNQPADPHRYPDAAEGA